MTVVMSHYGIEGDRLLAQNMPEDLKIDVILGGHSHIKMEQEEIVRDIPSAEAVCVCI